MTILEYFSEDLERETINYFIFDSKGGGNHGHRGRLNHDK